MAHARTQIRNAVISVLTGLTTTGANVFKSRVYTIAKSELPCLLVFQKNEPVERVSDGENREEERSLEFIIKAVVTGAEDVLDDLMDQVCVEVKKALSADPELGGLTTDLTLSNTGFESNGDGERPVGEAAMEWTAIYFVRETDPEVLANG